MNENKIHLIMPMGGSGSRFYNNGVITPKPMIILKGKPFFYWATRSLLKYNQIADLTFVVLQEHIDQFAIDKMIKQFFPESKLVVIPEVLKGPVLTCMRGVEWIDDQLPVIFNDCDHLFKSTELNQTLQDSVLCDAGLVSFEGDGEQFGYIKFEDGKIVGTVEKKMVSNRAICGAYLFRDKDVFLDAASQYIKQCNYTEFFMSGIYNVMCENGCSIQEFKVDYHINFGTPEEFEQAKSKDFFDMD